MDCPKADVVVNRGARVHASHGRLRPPGTGACARSAWSTTANEYAASASQTGNTANRQACMQPGSVFE
jgi:hypothetical protein